MTIDGRVYKLLKAMYGLRGAGGSVLMERCFDVMGKFSTCVGHWKVMDTLVGQVRWSDDVSLSGRVSLCNAFRDEL